ncbi:ribosome biogenesis GTPase Der [Candidatus Peregrinibacteria bacterium]|nr:ribosome biogenesis GTPase Der [Candidatus Peregrinibacteria bacterium]
MKTPIVTIVGRPNVGKSTLFNKIAGSRIAITAEESGTTRDRIFYKVEHPTLDFFMVDTGGLEFGKGDTNIEDNMQIQARVAIEEADLIVFVMDSKTGLVGEDYKAADLLRTKAGKKPVFLVANKCDNILEQTELAELYSLGLGEPIQVSAMHRTGIDMLLGQIVEQLKFQHFLTKNDPEYEHELKLEQSHRNIAMVGKPNVGKTSLINALLNKEKLIVSDVPGTTRDSTDSLVLHKGKKYNFIDTAGLKRPGRTQLGIEKFSALRSMASIERCDIALLVLDSSQPISHQDQQISSYIQKSGKGLIILANKWDIPQSEAKKKSETDDEDGKNKDAELKGQAEKDLRNLYIGKLMNKFPFLSWSPVIFTSAVTKKNLHHIFAQIELIIAERRKRISTAKLNSFVEQLILDHGPTGRTNVKPKLYYITQAEVNPPRFIAFVNKKNAFHFSYKRYLENRIREKFHFSGTPIILEYKEKPPR